MIYEHVELSAEVLVIGAGPAGIAAAVRIAESGKRVVVLDESPQAGGQIWRHRSRSTLPSGARDWIARLDRSGASIMHAASVAELSVSEELGVVAVVERSRGMATVSARSVVLATGARERFIPFPGWTLPGVIGIGGAQALLKAGLSFAGKRVVIAGSGPLLLPVAEALTAGGARVLLVAEQAERSRVVGFARGLWRRPSALVQAARYRAGFLRTPYRMGTWATVATGDGALASVDVTDGVSTQTIACDVLCSAQGLIPNTELAQLLGCALSGGAVQVNERQESSVRGVFCAGEITGIGGVDLAIVEGEIAGLASAGRDVEARRLVGRRDRLRALAADMEAAFALRAELRALATPDTIVCRCEDVRLGSIDPRWTMRQAKLYTRAGMGPCQGRVCGAALEFLHAWPPDKVRIPVQPAHVATLIQSRSR